MTKENLENTKRLFVDTMRQSEEKARESTELTKRFIDRHDSLVAIQNTIKIIIAACRSSLAESQQDNREAILNATISKIDDSVSKEVIAARDLVMIHKGKVAAYSDSATGAMEIWDTEMNSVLRAEEVAEEIYKSKVPSNGKNRKPGSRPEKLSIVRRAQEIIAAEQKEE